MRVKREFYPFCYMFKITNQTTILKLNFNNSIY